MSKIKTYKYRLYSIRKQAGKLNRTLDQCRILCNFCFVDRKNYYEETKKCLSRIDRQGILVKDKKNIPILKEIHFQVLQDALKRVDKAYKAFFRRLKDKFGKAGYPCFKSEGHYNSITYLPPPNAGI